MDPSLLEYAGDARHDLRKPAPSWRLPGSSAPPRQTTKDASAEARPASQLQSSRDSSASELQEPNTSSARDASGKRETDQQLSAAQMLSRTKRHRTIGGPASLNGAAGSRAPELDSRAFAAAAIALLDVDNEAELESPQLQLAHADALLAQASAASSPGIGELNPSVPSPPISPGGPPSPEEAETEDVIALAADLAASHLEKKEPALRPYAGVRPAAVQMSDGAMRSIEFAMQLAYAELERRSAIKRILPAAAALGSLRQFYAALDAVPDPPEITPPPRRRRPLFAVDESEPPLPPPLPPPDALAAVGSGPPLLALLEGLFGALAGEAAGARRTGAAREAARWLGSAPVLASELVGTHRGRIRLRRLLAKLGAATGSVHAALEAIATLVQHATRAALQRLDRSPWKPEDVAAAQVECRRLLDLLEALRPSLRAAPCDLFLLPFADALDMMRVTRILAQRVAEATGERDLLVETTAAMGEQHAMEGVIDEAMTILYEAWSVAISAGLSPSRHEARVILLLVENYSNDPRAVELAERLYWYGETEEDAMFEARVHFTLGRLAMVAAQLPEAREHFDKLAALLAALPLEERASSLEPSCLGHAGFLAIRAGKLHEGFMHWRDYLALGISCPDHTAAALDILTGTHRFFGHVSTLEYHAKVYRVALFACTLFDPTGRSPCIFHALCAIGELYARSGHNGRAALCFERAESIILSSPRTLPPDHPRMRRIRAALRLLRPPLPAIAKPLTPPSSRRHSSSSDPQRPPELVGTHWETPSQTFLPPNSSRPPKPFLNFPRCASSSQ